MYKKAEPQAEHAQHARVAAVAADLENSSLRCFPPPFNAETHFG